MAPDINETSGSHVTAEELRSLRDRALPAARLLALDRHVQGCPACRETLAQAGGRAGVFEAPGSPAHLQYEQLAGYLGQTLPVSEREAAALHLSDCSRCRTDLEDLRTFEQAPRPVAVAPLRRTPAWSHRLAYAALGAAAVAGPLGLLLYQNSQDRVTATREARQLREQIALREREAAMLHQRIRAAPPELSGPPKPERKPPANQAVPPKAVPAPPAPSAEPRLVDGDAPLRDEGGVLARVIPLPLEVREALRRGTLELPKVLASLRTEPETVRGASPGGRVGLLEPMGTVVLSDRPVLRWSVVPGALDYEVAVEDSATGEVYPSGPITPIRWQPPALPRGKSYTWQVTARLPGERTVESPTPRPRFQVLGAVAYERLAKLRQRFGESPLTMGVLYAQEGLLAEAERELRTFRGQNPDAPLARKLLQDLAR